VNSRSGSAASKSILSDIARLRRNIELKVEKNSSDPGLS
jgi:hypothetical protein